MCKPVCKLPYKLPDRSTADIRHTVEHLCLYQYSEASFLVHASRYGGYGSGLTLIALSRSTPQNTRDRDLKTRSLSRLRSQATHDDNGDVCQDMFVSTRSSQLRVLTSHLTRVTTRLREAEAPAGHRGRAVCSRATVARLSNLVEEDPPGCACANPPRERGRKEVNLVVTEYVPSRNPRRRVRRLLDDELLFRTPA